MENIKFDIFDKQRPKKEERVISIRLDKTEYSELAELARQNDLNFHRFVKAVLNGYINHSKEITPQK